MYTYYAYIFPFFLFLASNTPLSSSTTDSLAIIGSTVGTLIVLAIAVAVIVGLVIVIHLRKKTARFSRSGADSGQLANNTSTSLPKYLYIAFHYAVYADLYETNTQVSMGRLQVENTMSSNNGFIALYIINRKMKAN